MKVVVGGPPHSGKSTFTAILRKLIRDILGREATPGVFQSLTLDLIDNSTEWMDDPTGRTPRRSEGSFTISNAEARRDAFGEKAADLVIADAPGKITEHTSILVQPADVMIIVSKDQDGIQAWQSFAAEQDIEIYAVFETFLPDEGTAPSWDPENREGTLRGLDREAFGGEGVDGIERETVTVLRDLAYALLESALE